MSFDRFSYGGVNPWRHLLSQKLKQLSVFIYRSPYVRHDFGTHHVLCWSDKPKVVFCRLLQNIGRSLAVVLCQFGEIIIEGGTHVEPNLLSCFLWHSTGSS